MFDLIQFVFVKTCKNESSHTRSVPFFYLMDVRFHYNKLNFSRVTILSHNYWLSLPVGPFIVLTRPTPQITDTHSILITNDSCQK